MFIDDDDIDEDGEDRSPAIKSAPDSIDMLRFKQVEIGAPGKLKPGATETEAQYADLPILNGLLDACHVSITGVRTISGLEKVVNMTLKAIEGRRKVLGLPYGTTKEQERKASIIESIPD